MAVFVNRIFGREGYTNDSRAAILPDCETFVRVLVANCWRRLRIGSSALHKRYHNNEQQLLKAESGKLICLVEAQLNVQPSP